MTIAEYDHEAEGEVIKLIHGEYPAVRWTCGGCNQDAATIFDPQATEMIIECENCEAVNLVRRGLGINH
ncbi:MAG: hypothetical protein AB1631_31905 [Acidobacteriota bacterium]